MSSTHKTTNGRIPYGYIPTEWVCIVFVTLFGLSTIAHLFQAVRYRLWWAIGTIVICGLTEVVGWSGRLWSSRNPTLIDPFLMQITTLIFAPSFLTAAFFGIFAIIVRRVGPQYSWLPPRLYLILFLVFDVAALVIQSVGGATASKAARTDDDVEPGGRIMMYGIILQLIGIAVFCLCQADFFIRHHLDRPARAETSQNPVAKKQLSRNTVIMLMAMSWSILWILIRSIFRTIELHDGFQGRIIGTQRYFNILDGMAVFLAMFAINVIYPGRFLREDTLTVDRGEEKLRSASYSTSV